MELGQAKLRRNRINTLHNALHPVYGLVWTSGEALFLASVDVVGNKLKSVSSTQLATFGTQVRGVSWCLAPAHLDKGLLCIAHRSSVTIQCVSSTDTGVTLTQLCNISISAIPQGCIWSPVTDVLCILTSHQCHLYCEAQSHRQNVSLPCIDSGTVSCACWSGDGIRLIVAVGCVLHIYEWQDVDKSLDEFTEKIWKVPDVDGRVCALAAVSSSQVVCTTELPLDQLCHSDSVDLFQLPDMSERNEGNVADRNISECSDTVVLPCSSSSNTSSHLNQLMNLQHNTQCAVRMDCSQLVMFDVAEFDGANSISRICRTNVTGLLSPDLLYVYKNSWNVAVGSNTSSAVSVFHLSDRHISRSHELALSESSRPKGLCGWRDGETGTGNLLTLVMVGQVVNASSMTSVLVPSSLTADYQLSIQLHSPEGNIKSLGSSQAACDTAPTHETQQQQMDSRKALLTAAAVNRDERVQELIMSGSTYFNSAHPPDSDHRPIKLPESEHCQQLSSYVRPITELSDSTDPDDSNQLEIELTDFRDVPARFRHAVTWPSTRDMKTSPTLFDCESRDNKARGDNSLSSSTSQHCQSYKPTDIKTDKRNLLTSDSNSCTAHAEVSAECLNVKLHQKLLQQVALFSEMLTAQADEISQLRSKLDQLVAHITASDCRTYRPASDPYLVFLRTSDGSLQKTFVLDGRGRLRLDVVKQVFGVTAALEIIINGQSCVVSADGDGYIPLTFSHGQTVDVSPQTSQTALWTLGQ